MKRDAAVFFSKSKDRLTGFRDLAEAILKELPVESAILDGELAATDDCGRTMFTALIDGKKPVLYFAFDLLWLNGEDLRALPLLERKEKLKRIVPTRSAAVLYVDHARAAGRKLYELAANWTWRACGQEGAQSL